MLKNFRQLKQFLEVHYPELSGHIAGEFYSPPYYAVLLERAIAFVQMFALACIFLGDSVWNLVPFLNGPPAFYYQMKENPMFGIGFCFFILPSIVQTFVVTGAFEIIVDGVVVYSKLEEGRMPNTEDVFAAFSKVGLSTIVE